MRKTSLAALIVVAFVLLVAVRQAQRPAPTAPTATTTPAEQVLARALADHQPAVISFRSATCIPCKAMAKIVSELRPRYNGRVAIVDVSLDDDSPDGRLIEKYQIRVKPTTVVLTRSGELADTHIGVWPADELSRRLDDLVSR